MNEECACIPDGQGGCRTHPVCELAKKAHEGVRRITEGPFWAVMLPDGRFYSRAADLSRGPFLSKGDKPIYYPANGRVVRVRSVTYEVEDV